MPVRLPLEKREQPQQGVDVALIRELATVLDETGLTEIEVGAGDRRIRVARTSNAPAAVPVAPPPAGNAPLTAEAQPAVVDATHPGAVTSPMVGVVYLAPEPGAEAFVSVGDMVREGQTLFIVEAMKTMNPIRSTKSGAVMRILVENGAPVEYGEALLIIE